VQRNPPSTECPSKLTWQVVQIAWLTMATDMKPLEIAHKVGCSIQRVRHYQRKLRQAQHQREESPNGFGCKQYDPLREGCERCLDHPEEGCPYP